MNQAQFARLAGVSKPAIAKAISTGRLIIINGDIDPNNPLSAAYLAKHAAADLIEEHAAAPQEPQAPRQAPDGVTLEQRDDALAIWVRYRGSWLRACRYLFNAAGQETAVEFAPLPGPIRLEWDAPSALVHAIDDRGHQLEVFIDAGPETREDFATGRGAL